MAKTISFVKGKGNVNLNNREFIKENVDTDRIKDNISYVQQDLDNAFEEHFGETIIVYDSKQTRNNRKYGSVEEYMVRLKHSKNGENPDNKNPLAVKLLFKIGTRVGELVATLWDDMEDDNVHIQRMEANESEMKVDDKKLSFTKPKNAIVDHLKRKNDCEDRFLHLTPGAMDILRQVKEINERMNYPDEFIFRGPDGRTTRRQIAYCIEKGCAKAGILVKSAHDIRRTVASVMYSNDIALDEIRRFLGHKDEKTTLHLQSVLRYETNKMIDDALL